MTAGPALGLFGVNMGRFAEPGAMTEATRVAERLGFDSVWVGDHLVLPRPPTDEAPLPPDHPIIEPIAAIAHLAAVTESIRLCTGVIVLPQRHPVVLAKQAAALDRLSAGRFVLGIGAGYLEPELRAAGTDLSERGARTDEHLAAMRVLWSDDPASFHGRFIDFEGVASYPQPSDPGGVPVVVGGRSEAALRRAVSSAHGWFGFMLDLDETAGQIASLERAALSIQRPPWLGRLEVTVTPRGRLDRDRVEAYRALGVDRLAIMPRSEVSPDTIADHLTAYRELIA